MNYEQKYNEALERAKKMRDSIIVSHNPESARLHVGHIVNIFPELRESEDERIRKHIVTFLLEADKMGDAPEEVAKWLAYLEKQKEKGRNITANLLEDGITGVQRELIEFLANNIDASWVDVIKSADAYAHRIRSMFEKQEEQKPIIKGWVARDKALQLNFYTNKPKRGKTYWIENGGDSVQIMQDPEHLYEEQDFDTLDWKDEPIEVELVVRASTEKRQEHVPENEETGTRQEQKPAEWSEEDEMYLSQAIEVLEHENYLILADKLKSLRPQPKRDGGDDYNKGYLKGRADTLKEFNDMASWKPTKEQMEALAEALARLTSQDVDNRTYANLCALKSDLKKLI